jgi:putative transcriptional regulator
VEEPKSPSQQILVEQLKLGTRLREARTERKLSQAKLAKASGVCYRTIQYIEAGDCFPDLGTLYKLCHAMDFPVKEML